MNRNPQLDLAKAAGMFLVYYGHFAQRLIECGSASAGLQWKLIYSFHIPFFFFLSGIFFKPGSSLLPFAYDRFKRRIIPVLFFSAMALPLWVLMKDKSLLSLINDVYWNYLTGFPSLNRATWFFICLFTVEIGMMIFARQFSLQKHYRLCAYAVFFFLTGYFLNVHGNKIAQLFHMKNNFWYINDAFFAASFYIAGFASRTYFCSPVRPTKEIPVLFVLGIILFSTFNLNDGPFPAVLPAVMMVCSSYGNFLLFGITALSGTLFILFLIRLIPGSFKLAEYIGRQTAIYLGLGGITTMFIDTPLIRYGGFVPDSQLATFVYCVLYVSTMMLLLAPLSFILNKYMPMLVGGKVPRSQVLRCKPFHRTSGIK